MSGCISVNSIKLLSKFIAQKAHAMIFSCNSSLTGRYKISKKGSFT
jgi:hypothetical protein